MHCVATQEDSPNVNMLLKALNLSESSFTNRIMLLFGVKFAGNFLIIAIGIICMVLGSSGSTRA